MDFENLCDRCLFAIGATNGANLLSGEKFASVYNTGQTSNLWLGCVYVQNMSTWVVLRLGRCVESNLNSALDLLAVVIDASFISDL